MLTATCHQTMAKPVTPILSLRVRGNRAQKREVTQEGEVDLEEHRSWALGCRRRPWAQWLSTHVALPLRDEETEAHVGKEIRLQGLPWQLSS